MSPILSWAISGAGGVAAFGNDCERVTLLLVCSSGVGFGVGVCSIGKASCSPCNASATPPIWFVVTVGYVIYSAVKPPGKDRSLSLRRSYANGILLRKNCD